MFIQTKDDDLRSEKVIAFHKNIHALKREFWKWKFGNVPISLGARLLDMSHVIYQILRAARLLICLQIFRMKNLVGFESIC